ncbi:alpha-amylase family glycosyl hydrolase [Rudanella lutea]|uniref:alpha-amylase family glycosyl hydrolase n=1 Tax=Rudanella lutea TaxID=451374 RepID=UPI000487DD16|nr:alpha-amylase family glycosyl hydrolase [Rudanella lutea]
MSVRLLLFVCLFFSVQRSLSQVVTTVPAFPTADSEVTLIFDLAQAKDSRAAGLLGKTGDVYLWSGAGTTETGDAFQFQPTGQTNFNAPFVPGTMTALGNNKWQIRLVPRTYFNVPANQPIRRLGVLLKSSDGRAQTEDLYVRIYDNRLSINRVEPTEKDFFVSPNTTLPVRYRTSQRAALSLTVDGQPITNVLDRDSLRAQLNTGTQLGTRRMVVFRAMTMTSPTGQAAADTFYFTVRPEPTVAELPAGMRDGVNYTSPSTATLVLFAPRKSFVYAIGEFNNWRPSPEYLMKRTPDGNRYWIELKNLTPKTEIAYQYLVDGTLAVADPYATKILDPNNDRFIPATTYPNLKPYPTGATGIVSILQTDQTAYPWRKINFERPDPANLIVYELLVRDFSANRNYKTVTDSLPYLKRLGINCIEIMPIMEFAGNDSWGYNPIFYFAPDKAYGTADDLKRFIEAAHQQGIAVVLDMVLNQADYEYPYVKMYWDGNRPSPDNPFFNPQATHPFSVFFDFNHESPATQALVERVNTYWLQEFRFDGFRFDLSKGFTQKQSGNDVGSWSSYDLSRVRIWKRIYDQIRAVDPTAYVILEHFADNTEEKELADYGMMFWGNHNGDFRNTAKGRAASLNGLSAKERGWQRPNLIGYAESHDEERLLVDVLKNGRVENNYNTTQLPTALERAKLAAAFLITTPGPKLIWQFGELGYDVSIDENGRTGAKPIRWEYYSDPNRRKLYGVYRELINLKKTVPAFRSTDVTMATNDLVKRITLRDPANTIFLIGNSDAEVRTVPGGFPGVGRWYDFFTGESINITDANSTVMMQPGEFHLYSSQPLPKPEAGLVPFGPSMAVVTAVTEQPVDGLTLSPNPSADEARLELSNPYRGLVNLYLTDASGRELRSSRAVKTADTLIQTIDLRNLPNGLYIIRLQLGEQRVVRKVMKQ